jgi:PAS domain S-box-containing protein
MAEVFGFESVYTFKGMRARDFNFSDRDRELFVKELLDKGSFVGKEVLLKSREGKKIHTLISASAYTKEGYIEGVIVDISELKQAQEALAHRERMLERIFEHTGSTTIIVETDTTISKCNQQLVEMTGYTKDEVEGKMKWTDFVHPDDRPKMLAYHKARRDNTKADQVPKTYEFKLITKDGTIIPSYLTVGFIPETSQSVASVIDISQRKAAEKALRRERQAFQIIAEAAIQPAETKILCEQVVAGLINTLDFEMGTVRFYNEDDGKLEPLVVVGLNEDEKELIVTRSIDDPEFVSSIVARTKTSIFAPNVVKDEFLTKIMPSFNLPGIKAFISWPLVSSKKELIGTMQLIAREPKIFREEDRIFFESVAGMFAAILEIKLAEEALIESEEKYRTLIDSLPRKMAVIIIQDNRIVFSSPAGSEKMIFGPIDQILNKNPLSFVEEEERERIKNYMELRLGNTDIAPRNYETTLVDFVGNQFPAEIYATKTIYEGEPAIQAVISDITERKKTEHQRRLLSNIVDNSKEVVISADENGKIIYANPPLKDVFGWLPEEIIGKNISILDPPTRGTLQDTTFSNALKGENQTIETIRRHKNGSLVPVVMTVSSFKDEETEKITTSAIIVDISDIKQLEDTLKDRSYQLEVLNKVISAGISARNLNELLDFTLNTVLTSLDFRGGAIYLVNEEKTKAILKRSLGMSSSFVDQGKELDINSGVFKKIFSEGKSLKSDNFLRKSEDHKQFGIHTLLIVPFFSKQKVIGAIFLTTKEKRVFSEEELNLLNGIGREIGTAIAKILAEEETHIYEKNLQTIFNTIDHSFIIIDKLTGKIVKTNNTFAQKLGYTIKQLIQISLATICTWDEVKLEKLFKQFSSEKDKKVSLPFKTKKEDTIYIDFKIHLTQLGEREVFIAMSTEAD